MPNWTLEDVEIAAAANPSSFFIPAESERKGLAIGALVRLHFLLIAPKENEPRAERMWVLITHVDPNNARYEGELDNDPRFIEGLHSGDKIEFEPRHIAQVWISADDPRWVDSFEKAALVSKLVIEGEKPVRFMYRQKPDNERDSGWRLFSGYETDEYNDDPKNSRVCNVGWLLDFDPSLLSAFKHNVGSAFERSGKNEPWQEVTDWSPRED